MNELVTEDGQDVVLITRDVFDHVHQSATQDGFFIRPPRVGRDGRYVVPVSEWTAWVEAGYVP